MTSIIVLVHNRERLTRQTLESLVANTTAPYSAIVVIDNSTPETISIVEEIAENRTNMKYVVLRNTAEESGCVGALRNLGAKTSEWTFGRGEWLYFSDNDLYFRPGWLEYMTGMLYHSEDVKVLGGYRHPFHGVNGHRGFSSWGRIELTDAVAGYSMLMKWDTFDKYGPFDANAKGVCQSEDYAFCRKIAADGGLVGYSETPQILNCGLTNSEENPAIGHEHFKDAPLRFNEEGVIYE